LIYIAAVGGLGYLLGEAVSRSANRKRGRTLQYVAAAGIVASAATFVGLGAWIILFDLVAWGVALYLAIFALR
jgi:uncharacterized membrane protein